MTGSNAPRPWTGLEGKSGTRPPMAALSISHFDISTYLGNSLRAVRGDSDQTWDVILKFRPEMAGRVEENIWHHSQQLKG